MMPGGVQERQVRLRAEVFSRPFSVFSESQEITDAHAALAISVGPACRAGFFVTAARRTVSEIQQGETKSGAVIFGDVILKSKHVWSQVAAGLRRPARQAEPGVRDK